MIRGDDAMDPTPIIEEATPDVEEILQQDTPPEVPVVRVEVCNTAPIRTLAVPNRKGFVAAETVPGDAYVRILNVDPKRARAVIVSTSAFHIAHKKLGDVAYATWPANVVLEVFHGDELYASSTTADAVNLAVVTEVYAD